MTLKLKTALICACLLTKAVQSAPTSFDGDDDVDYYEDDDDDDTKSKYFLLIGEFG